MYPGGIMKTISTYNTAETASVTASDSTADTASKPASDRTPGERSHHHGAAPPALPPREVLDTAGDILRALAAPVRIAIVLQLRESHRCVHELVDALGVPQPLVSQHLRILKAAGVVEGERFGREVLYRLVDHHLAHIVASAVGHAEEDMP